VGKDESACSAGGVPPVPSEGHRPSAAEHDRVSRTSGRNCRRPNGLGPRLDYLATVR
jgi:hypothetical protein